jgi:hypothetical protein
MRREVWVATLIIGLTALEGCAGGSIAPTVVPSTRPFATVAATAKPAQHFLFPAPMATMMSTDPVVFIRKGPVTFTASFSANTGGNGALSVNLGYNNGDIRPAVPVDNAGPGSSIIAYVSFYNASPSPISFGSSTPLVMLTRSQGFNGAATCNLDVFSSDGTTFTWNRVLTGTVLHNTLTFSPAAIGPGGTVSFFPGQQIIAVACKPA